MLDIVFFLSICVKITPVFCLCSQIITLSTQSVMYSGHDGEWRFPTKLTLAQVYQIQSKALSAVSILLFNLLSFMLPCALLHEAYTLYFCLLQLSPVVRGSSLTCSRRSVKSVLQAPTLWALVWPLMNGTACRQVLSHMEWQWMAGMPTQTAPS